MDTAGVFRGNVPTFGAIGALAPAGSDAAAQTERRTVQPASHVTETAAPATVYVILPVYNESKLIRRTFDAVHDFATQDGNYHFVFADDGSSDGSAQIIRELIQKTGSARISLIAYPVNRGKGRTIAAAVRDSGGAAGQTGGDIVLFTDSDLAYSLDHLPRLVEALGDHDVVIGSRSLVHRAEKNTKIARQVLGWGFNRLARLILNLPYRDTQAGLKGFRRPVAQHLFSCQRIPDFSFDVELVYLARHFRYRITEIPAHVSEAHSYKISKVNLLRDPLKMFVDLVRIRAYSLRGMYK